MARVSSNEAKVTINGTLLKGVQSVSMDFDLEILDVPVLLNKRNQDFVTDKGIIGDSTTGSFTVTYYANDSSYDPFGSATQSIDDFIITDDLEVFLPNAGYKMLGANLTSCNLEVSIGGFLTYSLTYEFDRVESGGSTTAGEDADTTVYNPSDLPFVFYSDITPSGIFSGLCAQSISVTLDTPRKIVKKYGGGIIRQPDIPYKVLMEISVNRNDYFDLFGTNEEITADKVFSFSGGTLSYSFPQSRAISVSEGLDLDGTATQNINFEKILTN